MAISYDTPQAATAVVDALTGKLPQSTQDLISKIVGENAVNGKIAVASPDTITTLGADKVKMIVFDKGQTLSQAQVNSMSTLAIVATGDGALDGQTLNFGSTVKFAELGTADNATVSFASVAGQAGPEVIIGGGKGNTVSTGAGNDSVTFQGNAASGEATATINTGDGQDTVVLQGKGQVEINFGNADAKPGSTGSIVQLQGIEGAATVNAGANTFDSISIAEDPSAHTFKFVDGKFVMNSDCEVQMQNVNVVTYDTNSDGVINASDKISILADTVQDSLVGRLYQTVLGREAIDNSAGGGTPLDGAMANLSGFNFWTEQVPDLDTTDAGAVKQFIASFVNCPEFKVNVYDKAMDAATGKMDYTQVVEKLFHNLDVASDGVVAGQSVADYVDALNAGTYDIYDVVKIMVSSSQADYICTANGDNYIIEGQDFNLA